MADSASYVLDISRLVSRRARGSATGIDRIELSAAETALNSPDSWFFMATRGRRSWFVRRSDVERLVDGLARRWSSGSAEGLAAAVEALAWLGAAQDHSLKTGSTEPISVRGPRHPASSLFTREVETRLKRADQQVTYKNVSHHHLDKDCFLEDLKQRWSATVQVFWHDSIPIKHPEYSKPGDQKKHYKRLLNTAKSADLVLTNSDHTREEFVEIATAEGAPIPRIEVAPLRPTLPTSPVRLECARPFFLALGTIEPRKNHRLLLEIWRELAEDMGLDCPALLIVGRRGWMSSDTFALLDRCPSLQRNVHEAAEVPDAVLASLIHSAEALLMPSFAEGFGLPIAEAIALKTKVLASDLPVYKEFAIGQYEPLSPLDGIGWYNKIKQLAVSANSRGRIGGDG